MHRPKTEPRRSFHPRPPWRPASPTAAVPCERRTQLLCSIALTLCSAICLTAQYPDPASSVHYGHSPARTSRATAEHTSRQSETRQGRARQSRDELRNEAQQQNGNGNGNGSARLTVHVTSHSAYLYPAAPRRHVSIPHPAPRPCQQPRACNRPRLARQPDASSARAG